MEPLFRTNVPPYRLGALLLRIAERRLCGRLLLTSDLGERTIYFHSGFPVFAHSSQFSERLGAIGVRYGFLERDDVAAALALARDKGCEIGRAFIELGHLNGTQLFRLLGAQLIEQLAASCGPSAARARFLAEPDACDRVAILRLHPMTAVLAAVRHMPHADHGTMLAAVAGRHVANRALPEPAQKWLLDIGYLGDPATLVTGEGTTMAALRSRLVAKLRASTQQDFDPSASPIPLDVRKEDSVRPAAHSVTDYLLLTLLLSGAVELASDPSADGAAEGQARTTSPDGMFATLAQGRRSPFDDVPEMPASEAVPVDAAIGVYLEEKREARTAARLAIWGPVAEVNDDGDLEQVLTLYLTLKPEANDLAVLDVVRRDPPEKILYAHAKYRGFLRTLSSALTSPLAQARIAELEKRVDDAMHTLCSPAGAHRTHPTIPPPSAASSRADVLSKPPGPAPAALRPHGVPQSATRASLPPGVDLEALAQNVESRVREGSWHKVLELVEPIGRGRALPPTLSLARALAERSLTPVVAPRTRVRTAVAFLLGIACGWGLAYFRVLPLDLPALPF